MQVFHQKGLPRASASLVKPKRWFLVASVCFNHAVQLCATPVMAISTAGREVLDETWAFLTWETLLCWVWNGQGLLWSHLCHEELRHCQGWFSGGNPSPGRRPQWQGYMPPQASLGGLPFSLLPEAQKDTGFVLARKQANAKASVSCFLAYHSNEQAAKFLLNPWLFMASSKRRCFYSTKVHFRSITAHHQPQQQAFLTCLLWLACIF